MERHLLWPTMPDVTAKLPRWGEYFRAMCRLAAVAGLTHHQMFKLVVDVLTGQGRDHERPFLVARHAQVWAQRIIRRVALDVEVAGSLPKRPGLLVANHRSYIDIVAILSTLPSSFLAKAELRKWPVFGKAAHMGNTVFVDRKDPRSRLESRTRIRRRIREGIAVVVFPEGTTFEGPGLLPFHAGIFRLAAESDIPVIPVAVGYTNPAAAWTGDATFVPHFMKTFGKDGLKIRLSFGPALRMENAGVLKRTAHSWIAGELPFLEGCY